MNVSGINYADRSLLPNSPLPRSEYVIAPYFSEPINAASYATDSLDRWYSDFGQTMPLSSADGWSVLGGEIDGYSAISLSTLTQRWALSGRIPVSTLEDYRISLAARRGEGDKGMIFGILCYDEEGDTIEPAALTALQFQGWQGAGGDVLIWLDHGFPSIVWKTHEVYFGPNYTAKLPPNTVEIALYAEFATWGGGLLNTSSVANYRVQQWIPEKLQSLYRSPKGEYALEIAGSRAVLIDHPIRSLWSVEDCPEAFLPILAWGMAVDDWSAAWSLGTKRDVVRNAFLIASRKGTPWAVRNALMAANLADGVRVQEGSDPNYYDGQITHDGAFNYGPDQWAEFAVVLESGGATISVTFAQIEALIENYKPARSKLIRVTTEYVQNESIPLPSEEVAALQLVSVADYASPTEDSSYQILMGSSEIGYVTVWFYDGVRTHSGWVRLPGIADDVEVDSQAGAEDALYVSDSVEEVITVREYNVGELPLDEGGSDLLLQTVLAQEQALSSGGSSLDLSVSLAEEIELSTGGSSLEI